MQRVLSFQTARGFGESSEFVTKRMCFSFLFCVAFLSLLGGFLLGRFSTQRTGEIQAERKRQEFAGNGLESTGHLQQVLIEELQRSSFDQLRVTKSMPTTNIDDAEVGLGNVRGALSNLDLFHEIRDDGSRLTATVRGSREPDRLVVVSVSDDGIRVALELARVFARLHLEYEWTPKRTLVMCFFEENNDLCSHKLPRDSGRRIIAYLAIHGNTVQRNGCLSVAGSDIIRSTVLQAVDIVRNANSHEVGTIFKTCERQRNIRESAVRLRLDIPHAALSFVGVSELTNNSIEYETSRSVRYRILAEILSVSVWRLSDSLLLQWEPNVLEEDVKSALNTIPYSQAELHKAKIMSSVETLAKSFHDSIGKMNGTARLDLLTVRMSNDLLMDLDRALLCPDSELRSRTDLALITTLPTKSASSVATILNDMEICYESVVHMLRQT